MKILIAQGGGPTAVINQSLIGAVLEAKKHGIEVIGARHGIKGIVREDFITLSDLDDEKLKRIAETPASALGSTRDKPNEEYCTNILNKFQKHDIRGFFYIGGNDSSDTIRIVLDFAKKANYQLKGFHIPKTVDNDLMENDHTPGFPSAARFVAKAIMGIDRDNAALPGIHLCIIMGRHAGFLTAAAALGGAHRVYIPEHPFDLDEFAEEVKETFEKNGRAVIGISEGIQDKEGNPIITHFVQEKEVDAHGNIQLSSLPLGDILTDFLKKKIGASRVRSDTFGYTQRSYPDPSPIDSEESHAVGKAAIEYFMNGKQDSGSITITRTNNHPYTAEIGISDLEKIAGKTRHMPSAFFDSSKKTLTEEGIHYLIPLLGNLPHMENFDGDRPC